MYRLLHLTLIHMGIGSSPRGRAKPKLMKFRLFCLNSMVVYILFSEKLDKFYIGQTIDLKQRMEFHNSIDLNTHWSKNGIPWTVMLELSCVTKVQAIKVEAHIKKMKSKIYIGNLIRYKDMQDRLLEKFKDC